jgi:hypothetical protein
VRRPVALAALAAAAAAPGVAPAREDVLATELTIATSVEPRSSSAAIGWSATKPVRVVVEHGLTDDFGVWSKATSTPTTSGRVLLGALEPGTTYRYRLLARRVGETAETRGSFTTAPIPPWTTATTTKNALHLDWQPFFPRMVWRQCPWDFGPSLAAGVNVFMGSCVDAATQLGALAGRAFSVIDVHLAAAVGGRGLVGWHFLDEADEHMTPAALPPVPHSRQTRRVTFLTLTHHFYSAAAPLPQGRGMYPGFVARAEMIGFDLYPLQIWCRRGILHTVYDAQRELVALAAGKPTFQWIEAAPMNTCGGLDPSAAIVRAETWLAIAGGARGIGWFPDLWRPDVTAEIGRLSREIKALAPALLGPEVAVAADVASPVKVGARRYNGAMYVIAVNSSTSRSTATFTVPGVGSRSLRVLGEGRTVAARKGTIRDHFRGLTVHLYVASPPGA